MADTSKTIADLPDVMSYMEGLGGLYGASQDFVFEQQADPDIGLRPGTYKVSSKELMKLRVRRRHVKVGGKNFKQWTATATEHRSFLWQYVRDTPGFEKTQMDQIELVVRCCSGGAGGSWGGTTGYGGFGGIVVERRMWLTELPDDFIYMIVGAGAGSGNDSGTTQMGYASDKWAVIAQGVRRGGNSDTEEGLMHAINTNRGWDGPLRIYGAPPDRAFGPGNGGAHHASRPWFGGYSSLGNKVSLVAGPTGVQGADGYAAIADDWNSYGTGAAGNQSGAGGSGGFPGGGGGGSRLSTQPPSDKGRGGNGDIRMKFYVWDTVARNDMQLNQEELDQGL